MKLSSRVHLFLTVITLSFVFLTSCSKSNSNVSPTNTVTAGPTITSLSITAGPYNTAIAITGTGFSATGTQVFFNGVAATIYPGTTTQAYTRVPLAAGTGPVTVTVNGVTATGPVFTYQTALVVAPFAGTGFTAGIINGPGATATLYQPFGLALDAAGNIYVAEQANQIIRKITPAGIVSTFAGSGTVGAADGTGTAASFNNPTGVALDAVGNVFVTDLGNNSIRKITPAGVVTTLAGGVKGLADATGTAAMFNRPTGLAIDPAGNLYVTDMGNYRIRKVTPAGVVTTFAGNGLSMSKDGAAGAASFANPTDIAIDNAGNLYVTQGDNLIRKISGGVVTCIAGTSTNGFTITSPYAMPQGITVDGNGNIFFEDSGRYQINKIDPTGNVTVFAGSGMQNEVDGLLSSASFNFMEGIVIDPTGIIYISASNSVLKIAVQ